MSHLSLHALNSYTLRRSRATAIESAAAILTTASLDRGWNARPASGMAAKAGMAVKRPRTGQATLQEVVLLGPAARRIDMIADCCVERVESWRMKQKAMLSTICPPVLAADLPAAKISEVCGALVESTLSGLLHPAEPTPVAGCAEPAELAGTSIHVAAETKAATGEDTSIMAMMCAKALFIVLSSLLSF